MASAPGDADDRAALRELQLEGSAAVVEPTRAVLEDLGLQPLAVLSRDLPAQWRILRIDACAARLRALDLDPDEQPREGLGEAEVERVPDRRRLPERELVLTGRAGAAPGHLDLPGRAAALDDVGDRPVGLDRERLGRLEHDRLVAGGPDRADLGLACRDQDRLLRRRGKPEADLCGRAAGRGQAHPQELQQRDVQLVRDAVDAIDEHLGHPREQLDERDPGVRHVVLGPLGAGPMDTQARLVDELLEVAVVEDDLGKRHAGP